MRHSQSVAVLCLVSVLVGVATAAPPVRWSVTFPDTGTYSYWVQSKTGTVSVLPTTVAHKRTAVLPVSVSGGDTLCVLDSHTGQVAARALASPGPVDLALGDFKALPTINAPVSAVPSTVASSHPSTPPHNTASDPVGLFFSWLLGLAVAAGVVWFLLKLVRTRGEPLIALARKAGVDVPDPQSLDPNAEAPLPLYEAPKPRIVEKIPEEAGVAAPARRADAPSRKPPSPTGEPQLVGTQGLAAGSTFALTGGTVMIGRDGDNEIVLAESTVSRHHARLVRDGVGQIMLTDEESANGVYINGERVREATLAHGDEVKIGDNYFRFEA